jgi:phosphoribosylanthranilate isomerase
MRITRVKICGITRVDDALAAARRRAVDAVGLNFWPGTPRRVTLEQRRGRSSRRWSAAFVSRVGLFVDPSSKTCAPRSLPSRSMALQVPRPGAGHALPVVSGARTSRPSRCARGSIC